jgi:hypothetical protein
MHTQCRMVNSLDQLCAGETRAGSIIPDLTKAAQLHLHPVEWVCLPVHKTLGSMCFKKKSHASPVPNQIWFGLPMHSPKIDFLSPQTNNMSNPSRNNNKLEKSELEPGYTGFWGRFWFQFWKNIQSSELAIWVPVNQTKNQNQNQNLSQTKTLVYTHLIMMVKRLRNWGVMNLWRKSTTAVKKDFCDSFKDEFLWWWVASGNITSHFSLYFLYRGSLFLFRSRHWKFETMVTLSTWQLVWNWHLKKKNPLSWPSQRHAHAS